MMELDWIAMFRYGIGSFMLVASALIWWQKRAFKAIDLIWVKHDIEVAKREALERKVHKMALALVAVDPSKTAMFDAFMKDTQ